MMARLRWIAHAGLAGDRPGGTPTRLTLAGAARLRVDWLEIDVCQTADGSLVLRHDLLLPSRRPIRALTLTAVRGEDPEVLTLDEAAEAIDGAVPVLVDLRSPGDADAVASWLGARPDAAGWAVCTDDPVALQVMRSRAPRVARWRSLPRVAPGRGEAVRRIAACALRGVLPHRLGALAEEVGAAALSVDRWAVTPALCARAHGLQLPIAAWTVNAPSAARRMDACGVDYITTDRVEAMRSVLGGSGGPSQDGAATGRCDS
jgi:glycerophosphoryl diester phosphodiesterase